MATTWSSHRCFNLLGGCELFDLHRFFAIPVACFVFLFVVVSLLAGGWTRSQWPLFSLVVALLSMQIALGVASVHLNLSEPFVTIAHQLVAAILVALLAALSFRRPDRSIFKTSQSVNQSLLETCHG